VGAADLPKGGEEGIVKSWRFGNLLSRTQGGIIQSCALALESDPAVAGL
jgi:hypothetical protein